MSVWILPLWAKWKYLPFRLHVLRWRPHHSKIREQIPPGFPLWPDLQHSLKMPNEKTGLMVLESRVQDLAVYSSGTVSRGGHCGRSMWQNQQLTHEPVSKRNESGFSTLSKTQIHMLRTSHWVCFLRLSYLLSPRDNISTWELSISRLRALTLPASAVTPWSHVGLCYRTWTYKSVSSIGSGSLVNPG